MDHGFIKLSRKFFTHELWTKARTYSACEAWLFLIKEARFEASPRTESIGGREITWHRGQYPASIRHLARQWMWSERSVRSFLEKLKKKGMITTECTQGMNILTLCRYEIYNGSATPCGKMPSGVSGAVAGTGHETGHGTADDPSPDKSILLEISNLREMVTQLTAYPPAQPQTQPCHDPGTSLKKEEERKEEKECKNTPSLSSCGEGKGADKVVSFSFLREKLLSDDNWKQQAGYLSEIPSGEFLEMLPASIDKFFAWIQAIGEEHTLSTLKDAKRRFVYWWKFYESQKQNPERKAASGMQTHRPPEPKAPKDYSSRF